MSLRRTAYIRVVLTYIRYRMEASKASTMRMVMFTELGIECSYTVEASLAGARGRHFGVEDLIRMGADLGRWCVVVLSAFVLRSLFIIMIQYLSACTYGSRYHRKPTTKQQFYR